MQPLAGLAIQWTATPSECSGAYDDAMYDKCEVGDLSGKYGQVFIDDNGQGQKTVSNDPVQALDTHFVDGTTMNPPIGFPALSSTTGRHVCSVVVLGK